MDKIMRLEYIDNNQMFSWTHEEYMEAGRKGVVANDLGYDYNQIDSLIRVHIYEDKEFNFAIQKYLVRVKISDELVKEYLAIFHLHFGFDLHVYYVEL